MEIVHRHQQKEYAKELKNMFSLVKVEDIYLGDGEKEKSLVYLYYRRLITIERENIKNLWI